MSHRTAIAIVIVSGICSGTASATAPGSAHEETCRDLGAIAYYAATAPLSRDDRAELKNAERRAAWPNDHRPAIGHDRIRNAVRRGVSPTGPGGAGPIRPATVRDRAILRAMDVHRECLLPADTDRAGARTCRDLGAIAYHSAASSLSGRDKAALHQAEDRAAWPTPERPAIRPDLVDAADTQGALSHGLHGPGLDRLVAARGDGVYTALDVNRQCLQDEEAFPAAAPALAPTKP